MAKKKKHILSFEEAVEFDMIGICSHHSDYRLAWNINTSLNIHLNKIENYLLSGKKGIETAHSMYEFSDEEDRLTYFLIKNKQDGHYLIPEKSAIDYFLFLCDNCAVEISDVLAKLKTASSVLGAYQFAPKDIASAQNVVLT
ncbi:MAG: IPExxxVDY family protein [Fluviicola sp.]|nr:IPExxxVDY family protein [Fluviicola sp.]